MRIEVGKRAQAFLKELPAKQAAQIAERLTKLADNPDSLPSEQLKGYAPLRRLRSGEFRVAYEIDGDTLRVHLIGKRNDDEIYKALQRFWKK